MAFSFGACSQFAPRFPNGGFGPHSKEDLSQYGISSNYYSQFEIKHRRRTTKFQFTVLEKSFSENTKPSASTRRILAEQLEMTPRGVQVWFQNRRAKAKMQRLQAGNLNMDEISHLDNKDFGMFGHYSSLLYPDLGEDSNDLSQYEDDDHSPEESSIRSTESFNPYRNANKRFRLPLEEPATKTFKSLPCAKSRYARRSSINGPLSRTESQLIQDVTARCPIDFRGHVLFSPQSSFYPDPSAPSSESWTFLANQMPGMAFDPKLTLPNSQLQMQQRLMQNDFQSEWSSNAGDDDSRSIGGDFGLGPFYPASFDPTRRASCPADFIASFLHMGMAKDADENLEQQVSQATSAQMLYASQQSLSETSGSSVMAMRAMRENGNSGRRASVANLNLATIREDEDQHPIDISGRLNEAQAEHRTYSPLTTLRRASSPLIGHHTDGSLEAHLLCGWPEGFVPKQNAASEREDKVDELLREIMMPVSQLSCSTGQVANNSTFYQESVSSAQSMVMSAGSTALGAAAFSAIYPPHSTSLTSTCNGSTSMATQDGVATIARRASMPSLSIAQSLPMLTPTIVGTTRTEAGNLMGVKSGLDQEHGVSSSRVVSPSMNLTRIPEDSLVYPSIYSTQATATPQPVSIADKTNLQSQSGGTHAFTVDYCPSLSLYATMNKQRQPTHMPTPQPYYPQVSNAWTSEAIEFQL